MGTFIAILRALPTLITVLKEIWEFIRRASRDRPEELLAEISKSLQEVNNAKTDEERSEAARRIANLWRGQ